jgi:tetratricopeptide (TPR) repeat protein
MTAGKFRIAFCLALLSLLALLTYRQAHAYRDIETLWRTTISANPQSAMAHNNLGVLLLRRDNVFDAIYYLERGAKLDPLNPENHNNFGSALRKLGRLEPAIAEFRKAAELLPKFALYHANLASALTEAGRNDEAIAEYELAVRASPSDAFVTNNLAWLLATKEAPTPKDVERAVEMAERAVALSKDNPVNTGTLAAAYASAGRFKEAIEQAERARELATRRGLNDVASLLDEMLASYRAGRRFR